MERLTYDFCVGNKHCWQVKGADNLECREVCRNQGENGCTDCPIAKAFDRLAAYEETGLEPEELAQAKKKGRLVVLPCSIEEIERILDSYGRGMTLRTENAQRLEIIKEIPINRLRELAQAEKEGRLVVLPCKDWFEIVFGEQELFWGIDTDYIETPIREISVDNAERFTWYDGWKTLVLRGNDENGLDWEFSPEDIGKTVFLTREAAEAALEEKECTK